MSGAISRGLIVWTFGTTYDLRFRVLCSFIEIDLSLGISAIMSKVVAIL